MMKKWVLIFYFVCFPSFSEELEKSISTAGKELVEKIGDERIKSLDKGIGQVARKLHKSYLSLKAGANVSYNYLKTKADTKEKYDSYGFNTHFGYKWSHWEIAGSSYIHYGKVDHLDYIVNGEIIRGHGSLRFVSMAPILRLITDWQPIKDHRFFVGGGPLWSIKTVKLQKFETNNGAFSSKTKITYESIGGMLVFGMEEQTPFKEMHPIFYELALVYQNSFRVSTVDTTKVAETNVLTTQKSFNDLETFVLMFSMGITIF